MENEDLSIANINGDVSDNVIAPQVISSEISSSLEFKDEEGLRPQEIYYEWDFERCKMICFNNGNFND